MNPIGYLSVGTASEAIAAMRSGSSSACVAGGTNLIDEMKLGVRNPAQLVDINSLSMNEIDAMPDGGVRVGALVRNSDMAWHPLIRVRYPVLSQAILSGASPQLRNMATTGGNLLQRTRCTYYRDISYPCNKRQPGSGCSAIGGFNRCHAILGTSERCIATHPSDMCTALAALEPLIRLAGPQGDRVVPFSDFYISYGEDPSRENILAPGELITAIDLPPIPWARQSHYLKVRDRASYEFALTSAAIAMDMQGERIRDARVALGGVATKPWRSVEAENVLRGQPANETIFKAAADAALQNAKPEAFNGFKVELAKRTLVQALMTTASMA